MKKLILSLILLSQYSFANEINTTSKDKYSIMTNGYDRTYEFEFPVRERDPEMHFDRSEYQHANPFIPYPFTVIKDTIKHDQKIIYSEVYHTTLLGLRVTKNKNQTAPMHLIFSGDSNMFGVGVRDEDAFPSRIGVKIKSHTVYNMGLAGTGPNSALYFLEHYDLKKILGNQTRGMFIYDFHHYLIERVVGSKAFIAWSINAPRYAYEDGQLVYKGPFEKFWLTSIYKLLNKLPFNQTLFPNLPRIGNSHIELVAKVFAQMKVEYLKQTEKNNRFIILINPKYSMNFPEIKMHYLIECLKKEGIETLSFLPEEILPMPQIPGDGHFNGVAHENYSLMLMKKMYPVFN